MHEKGERREMKKWKYQTHQNPRENKGEHRKQINKHETN